MRTLSIEAASRESAYALCGALDGFGARVLEQAPPEACVVRVELEGEHGRIAALLRAIQDYVAARGDGPAVIELDGRSHLLDAST